MFAFTPRIVIRDHTQQCVRQFSFAREAGLGHCGHADDVCAPLPIHPAFRAGRKLRPLHSQIAPAAMNHRACRLCCICCETCQPRTDRVSHRNMCDQPFAKERIGASVGTVNKLVNRHKAAGSQIFAQRSDLRDCQNVCHPASLQHIDVGAGIYRFGRNAVTFAVTRQKHEVYVADPADCHSSRRLSKWR